MARNNRKQAIAYSVFILWWHNLGFGEPIQSYSSCLNDSKTPIVRIVETSRVNSINREGDLGKSGPGPRPKSDGLKNARKTGGGSIFAQGFTPQRQYGSRPINNKPLSCRNNIKINQEQVNGNQNLGGSSSSMETMSKRLNQEYTEYQQKFNYENLLSNQNVTATTNTLWAIDITTLRLFRGQKVFVFLCIDIHTNYIVVSLISKQIITIESITRSLERSINQRLKISDKKS